MLCVSSEVALEAWKCDVFEPLSELWLTSTLSDMKLTGWDSSEVHQAHSALLAAASPLLKPLLIQGINNIRVESISFDTWKYLLQYVYTGQLSVPNDQLDQLLKASDELEIQHLHKMCKKLLQDRCSMQDTNKDYKTLTFIEPMQDCVNTDKAPVGFNSKQHVEYSLTDNLRIETNLNDVIPPSSNQTPSYVTNQISTELNGNSNFQQNISQQQPSKLHLPCVPADIISQAIQLISDPKSPLKQVEVMVENPLQDSEDDQSLESASETGNYECNLDVSLTKEQRLAVMKEQPIMLTDSVTNEQPILLTESVTNEQPILLTNSVTKEQPVLLTNSVTKEQPILLTNTVTKERPVLLTNTVTKEQPVLLTNTITKEQPIFLSNTVTKDQLILLTNTATKERPVLPGGFDLGQGGIVLEATTDMKELNINLNTLESHGLANAMLLESHIKEDQIVDNKAVVSYTDVINRSAGSQNRSTMDTEYTRKYPKKLQCSVCSKTFRKRHLLKTHMTVHTGLKPHKCDVCNKGFVTQRNLKTHMSLHLGLKPWQCSTCNRHFSTKAGLQIHERTHTGEKPYECRYCNKAFSMRANCRTHILNIHNNNRSLECNICVRSFTSESALNRHCLVHTDQRPYKCDTCGKSFRLSTYLQHHQKTHQHKRKMLSCGHCGKKYIAPGHMKQHEASCMPGDQQVQCNKCQKSFKDSRKLRKHEDLHDKFDELDLAFCCKECPRKFSCIQHVDRHMLVHQKKTCPLCLREFSSDTALWNHQKRWHGDNEDAWLIKSEPLDRRLSGSIQCPLCDKTVECEKGLKRHITVMHDSDALLICCICGKLFRSDKGLRRHEEEDHKDKPLVWRKTSNRTKYPKPVQQHFTSRPQKQNQNDDNQTKQLVLGKQDGAVGTMMVKVEEDYSSCSVCGKIFMNATTLQNHIERTHNGTESDKNKIKNIYVCSCNKMFTELGAYNRHKRRHVADSDKPVGCDFCDKRFVEKWDWKMHMKARHKQHIIKDG